jgi:hypothetical protein
MPSVAMSMGAADDHIEKVGVSLLGGVRIACQTRGYQKSCRPWAYVEISTADAGRIAGERGTAVRDSSEGKSMGMQYKAIRGPSLQQLLRRVAMPCAQPPQRSSRTWT